MFWVHDLTGLECHKLALQTTEALESVGQGLVIVCSAWAPEHVYAERLMLWC